MKSVIAFIHSFPVDSSDGICEEVLTNLRQIKFQNIPVSCNMEIFVVESNIIEIAFLVCISTGPRLHIQTFKNNNTQVAIIINT